MTKALAGEPTAAQLDFAAGRSDVPPVISSYKLGA